MIELRGHAVSMMLVSTILGCNYDTRDATEGAFGDDGMPASTVADEDPDDEDPPMPASTGGTSGGVSEEDTSTDDPSGVDTDVGTGGPDSSTTGGGTTLPGMTVGMTAGLEGCYGHPDEPTCVADGCDWVFLEGAGYICSDPGVFDTGGGNLCELIDEMFCEQFDCVWDGAACVPADGSESSGGASTGSTG